MTTLAGCPSWEELTAWWVGDLDAARAPDVEEHVLACDRCARRAEALWALVDGLVRAARSGTVTGPVTSAVLRRLERDGIRVHRYRIAPGQVVPCSVWPDDDVMAAQLAVEPAGVEPPGRVDLLVAADRGPELRLADVPVDRSTGLVTWLSAAGAERGRPASRLSFRLLRVADDGESTLGEYALAHEPWAGPGSPR